MSFKNINHKNIMVFGNFYNYAKRKSVFIGEVLTLIDTKSPTFEPTLVPINELPVTKEPTLSPVIVTTKSYVYFKL